MQRRGFQKRLVLTGILLTLWAGRLLAQPTTGDQKSGSAPDGRTVIPANLFVDNDNAGTQDGSALHPFRTVQQAIKAAKDKAVIAVAGGIYPENIRMEEKAVLLYGGYVGGTKASYASGKAGNFTERNPAANASHLKGDGKDSVVTMYESGASVVDGFLITAGGRSSVAAPSWIGGGFYIYQGSPTISNNVIEKNQTCPPVKQDQEKLGGGIYATAATISILNNVIRNNVSGRGAGIYADGPKMVIRGNTVQNNIGVSDHGGGIFISSPNAEFSYNRVEGNEIGRDMGYGWGGGMIVVNKGCNFKLSHNVFTGNFAPSLGSAFFADEGATASMDHDLVYGNKSSPAGEGGAVYVDGNENGIGSSLTLNHVTIADHNFNPMVKGNAVKATWNSKLIVKNSILWKNGGDDVEADERSKATVTYTLSQETNKGTGNLSKDPLFVNAAEHDYRLRQGSPAIGAAEPDAKGGRADLGADGKTALAVKAGKDNGGVKVTSPNKKAPNTPHTSNAGKVDGGKKTGSGEKTSKTYLLRGTAGELPSEVGDDNTKMSKVASKELGGTAIRIELLDTFGQRKAKVEDWTPFHALRLDIVNQGDKELEVGFNLFHSGTKAFATRVVAPFVLKPGKNEVRIAVKDLKNTDGSPAELAEVRRWYVASETPVSLLVGDIFLETPRLGGELTVRNAEQLRAELQRAKPGTTIALAPGRYSPDIYVEKLRGTKDKPIIIAAADERDPPLFAGGEVGLHFAGCSYVTLRGLKVSGSTGNGINADDAGNTEEPSQGMVFENIVIEDIGPKGTHNALKLSGLDKFAVRGCTFSGWGGSAIDMVGCHDGVVQKCRFLGKSGFSQDTGVQIKGGSERIIIKRNFFKEAGGRAVNLGGSTDLEFFRPKVRNYEAKDVEVAGNHFVGSRSPVVYASSIQCTVRHNTIVNPETWVLRILQEQPTDKFLPCQKGVFEANLIVFDRRVQVFVNVGPDTKPETFSFADNAWFCTDGDRRPTLPVRETGGIYQVDPMLENADAPELKLGSKNPQLLKIGVHAFEE